MDEDIIKEQIGFVKAAFKTAMDALEVMEEVLEGLEEKAGEEKEE